MGDFNDLPNVNIKEKSLVATSWEGKFEDGEVRVGSYSPYKEEHNVAEQQHL